MNGNKALLDTNIIIFASKNQVNLEKLLSTYGTFYTSIISYMEVYGFDFTSQEEKGLVDELFDILEIVEVNRKIANQVIIYKKSKTKKIKLPDAIILATAHDLEADLITDDWEDFKNIDTNVRLIKLNDYRI